MVDNALSPHGGTLIERIASSADAANMVRGLPSLEVREQIARECVNIAYGFFSPLQGFMNRADVDSVARQMTLASGYIWSIPIVLDADPDELSGLGVRSGDSLLLTHQGHPLAVMEIEEIYSYDKEFLARQIYGTAETAHPGVQRTQSYRDRFRLIRGCNGPSPTETGSWLALLPWSIRR